ncbi:MAG: hypothetical protein V3U90_04660 [Dehalococcoidia bacterium]
MKKRLLYPLVAGILAVGLLAAAACGGGEEEEHESHLEPRVETLEQNLAALQAEVTSLSAKAGKISAPAGEARFYVTAYEAKGSTTVQDLAPPSGADLDVIEASDGYGFKGPGEWDASNPDKWGVESYQWWPGSMVALQGDTVTLTVFIINGNKHSTWVEAPDGTEIVQEIEMNRGREYELSFVASQQGIYRLVCNEHEPTMTAYILVLPRA